MVLNIKNIINSKRWDYFILVIRCLLAYIFFQYGYSKLTGGQFGLKEVELNTPIKDLSLFRISWYLFDHQPFKFIVGLSQIICALLLMINRTVILGAFMFLPIVATILIIDISFMSPQFAYAFLWRLSIYILLDILILIHYKGKMLTIWKAIWDNKTIKYKHSIWGFILIPVFAIILEFAIALPKAIVHFFIDLL
ncbi:MAG: DoxX family membrane protein [Winogradskyella sp.]|uniref:DoxX family membrane protein n=1 Tax=Winogradskyella sp. TaxID=1883156 RepID=UPI000F3DB596|nr:DoxX family membrane protein [Winogradskyella sp.]RNC87738.1 MAG: DoxX family membrane protein [Winogradskyella sp.]